MKLRAAAKNKNGTLSPTIAGLLFLERLIILRKFSQITFWIIVRNAMIKLYAGYSGHILTKVIGAVIYTTFSARYVPEWMMM